MKEIDVILKQKFDEVNSILIDDLKEDGLFSGKLGLLYFYLNLYKFENKKSYKGKVEDILGKVFGNIEEQTSSLLLDSTLGAGLSGLGYIIIDLKKEQFITNEFDDQLIEINELVYNSCLTLIEGNNFDYLNGSIGILYYLILVEEKEYVSNIIDKLYLCYKSNDNNFYNNTNYIEGIHFGYAHGLPAIVKVLNYVRNNEKVKFIIENILEGFLALCSNTKSLNDSKYYLPRSIHKGNTGKYEENWRPVLAWSNSDLNFSTLINSIDKRYISQDHIDYGDKIMVESTKRKKYNQTRINDYRFSFGSAGVAQLYLKFYKSSGSELANKMYSYWIEQTLDLLLNPNCSIDNHKLDFLNNLPATILTLYQFKNKSFTDWDKIFLL